MADAPQRDAEQHPTEDAEGFNIPTAERETAGRAFLQILIGAIIFAGLTAAYVWNARRAHEVQLLIADARPLIEQADVVSLKAAEEKLNEALSVQNDERALVALAEVHTWLWLVHGLAEHEAKARSLLSEAEGDNVERAERYGVAALIAVHEGRHEEAIKIAEEVIAKGGVSERLSWTTGLAQRATGKLKAGRQNLREAQDTSSSPHYTISAADAYEADADRFNAHTFWSNAARANSNFVPAAARSLMVKVRKPEPEAVITAELKRLDEIPAEEKGKLGEAAIEIARAEVHYYSGKVEESLQAADKALELGGKSTLALYARARALQALGKGEEAVTAYQEALAQEPGAAKQLYALARGQSALGKHDEALAELDKYKEDLEQSAPYHTLRGEILTAAGKFKEAGEAFDKALEVRDRHPEAFLGQAVAAWKQKKYDDATKWFEKAVSARSKFPEAYEALGLMWVEQGASSQANLQLEEAEKLFVARGTDAVRLKQFYSAVIKAYSASSGGSSYVAAWTTKEKKLSNGG